MGDSFRASAIAAATGLVFCLLGCAHQKSTEPLMAAAYPRSIPEDQQPQELRVMTFNVRVRTVLDVFNSWNSRKALLVQTIREFDPDILGTQECLADQSDYLRAELKEYEFVGAGRDDGARGGEMCGIFYKSNRFQRVDAGHFWLSDSPDSPGSRSWGSAFTRMATWVKLRPRDGRPAICVINTHFDVFGARARYESARLVRQRIQQIAPGMSYIITGDFNDKPDSAAYRTLIGGESGLTMVDAFRAIHPTRERDQGTRHGFGGDTDGPRIDWILTSNTLRPVEALIFHTNRNGKYPSDHFPVGAVFHYAGAAVASN